MQPEDQPTDLAYRPYEEEPITMATAGSMDEIRKIQSREKAKREASLTRMALNLAHVWKISIEPNSPDYIKFQLVDGRKMTISPRRDLADLAPDTAEVYDLFAKLLRSGAGFALIPSEFIIQ